MGARAGLTILLTSGAVMTQRGASWPSRRGRSWSGPGAAAGHLIAGVELTIAEHGALDLPRAATLHRPDPATARTDQAMHSENFPVALAVLPRALRTDLTAVYRYARHVDDLGDEAIGDRVAALHDVAADVHRLYAGATPHDPVVRGLARTVADRRLPMAPLLQLVEANLVDQQVTRYATFDALLGYCRLSADPVGRIVLHLFDRATADRVVLSDRICTGLQLVEHWQDVAEDHRRGRVYLPQEDLRRFGVSEADLSGDHASPALQALLAYETGRSLAWLNSGAVLVSTLHGWARLAVSGYVAGGRAAGAELRRAGYDPLARVPKPNGRDMARAWLSALVSRPG